MAYQALYRAWRPRTFTEICGQDAITLTLKRQVTTGRIAHAYLFCGSRGTGKTSAAKVLSRAINCQSPVDGDPCGTCPACNALLQENCMDVMEIDAASNNGVDEIRDLRDKIKYPPTVVRYKVYIIDEVHMLSTGAFNALLKTLEEPPAHAVFILATTEPQKLPATILSRCQRFDFHRITADVIIGRLETVLAGIGRDADADALAEIARAAEGGMRDALSLLDVCLSRTDGKVTLQLALEAMGTAGRGSMFRMAEAVLNHDAAACLSLIDEMLRVGCDPQVLARDITDHLRAVLLAKNIGKSVSSILECTAEDADRYILQSSLADSQQITRQMELFMRLDGDMKYASRPRSALELAAVRACHPETEADAGLAERLSKLEKAMESGVTVKKTDDARPAAPAKPVEKPKQTASAAPVQTAVPPQQYLDAIAKLAEENASIRKAVEGMRFIELRDGVVRVEFEKSKFMFKGILEKKQQMLDDAMTQAFGQPMHMALQMESVKAANKIDSTARDVISQAYDVFGRENIDLHD